MFIDSEFALEEMTKGFGESFTYFLKRLVLFSMASSLTFYMMCQLSCVEQIVHGHLNPRICYRENIIKALIILDN